MAGDSRKAVEQFSCRAQGYVSSPTHALGEDLALLARQVGYRHYRRALDVATGGGHTALTVSAFCDEVVATDPTPAMLDAAREHIAGKGARNIRFQIAEAERLPFPQGHFDLLACRIAAHHFHSIDRFAAEAFRVLEPNGLLALIDSVAPQPPELDQFINWIELRRDGSHQRNYTEQEWRLTLERAGFVVVYAELVEKRHNFAEWTARAGMTPEDAARLSKEILAHSDRVLAAYDVHKDPGTGQVKSLADLKIFIKALRPPPPRQ